MSAADIARIAGVRPSAVSNWRRRHDDFPRPVGGTDKSPRFDLAAVEAWLRAQGRMPEIPAGERLWQAFESARGVMPTRDALGAAGLLLYYLHRHPGTPVPYDSAEVCRVLDEAEHALAFGNSVVAGLIGLRRPFDPGARETTMLHAVAQAASGDDPARVFEYLCSRALDGGARTGLMMTPPELADLMPDPAGAGRHRRRRHLRRLHQEHAELPGPEGRRDRRPAPPAPPPAARPRRPPPPRAAMPASLRSRTTRKRDQCAWPRNSAMPSSTNCGRWCCHRG